MWFRSSFIDPFESIYLLYTKLCAQLQNNNNNNKLTLIQCLSYTKSCARGQRYLNLKKLDLLCICSEWLWSLLTLTILYEGGIISILIYIWRN